MENKIILNENYWDCECEDNYIHSCEETKCERCGAEQEDCPNSRQNEIDEFNAIKQIKEGLA